MNTLKETLGSLNTQSKSSKSNNKRKWREIELLKDQHQLDKDLKAFDDSLAYMFDDY